jgi:protein tyrosine/serine phosphatase
MSRKKIGSIALLGGLLLVGGAVLAWWLWLSDWPAHRFLVVQPGVLYRGGQPSEAGLKDIFGDYHIRTVVNLRGADANESWWRAEHTICGDRGVGIADVDVGPGESAAGAVRQFLAIATDPNCQPVFVHCEAGTSRTGFAVAAYRIAVQRWSYDSTMEEAARNRFNPDIKDHPVYDRLLRLLAEGADWRAWPDDVSATSRAATVAAHRP